MSRDALVIGINTYRHLQPLNAPAEDAEAIAQRLEQYGDFRVRRVPEFLDPFDNDARRIAQNADVSLEQLEEALVHLFKPTGKNASETALLFFSGHGLRKDRGIQEGYLATSDVNPTLGNWGLSLQWLRRLLQESSVRQQIIWLDCCYSGELLNFDEADPGDLGRGRDRCFISASREYEVAFEETGRQHSLLTGVLLDGLDPNGRANGLVTNFTLTNFIQQSPTLRAAPQQPLFANSGSKIILLGKLIERQQAVLSGICPYKGLAYFDCNDEDPKYFHGRTALTDSLLEKVREGNFLAVLGASGSGKSSVIRAGLLHQLKLGQRLSGSDEWTIHIVRPGEHPLQNLALAFLDPYQSDVDRATQLAKIEDLLSTGAVGLAQLAKATKHRLVLVIDQLEEVFTVCRDGNERQQFFECLLGALDQAKQQICLIFGMRADFFSKCLEQDYIGLASKIQSNLVTVSPMKREDLTQVITEPAKQVGLEVEQELITQILTDVESSPGSLPLLQYTLTELWKQRAVNWLTFSSYNHLGGVQGTLQKRADEVYALLSTEEQAIAKQIFLALTQVGEGTEDTRRQVAREDLVSGPSQAKLVDQVINKLSEERLLVTSELVAKGLKSERIDVVDVAHEALIRHWPQLQQWIEDNRELLKRKRDVEVAANAWRAQGKTKDAAYLLQGRKLLEAENFLQTAAESITLSTSAQELICRSQQARRNAQFRTWSITVAVLTVIVAAGGFAWQQWNNQRFAEIIRDTSLNRVRPELLPISKKLKQQADDLAASNNVDEAIINYSAVLRFTSLLKAKATQDLSIDLQSVEKVANSADEALVAVIHKHRLPKLEDELKRKNDGIGELDEDAEITKYENRFTEGALRVTYRILMQDYGVKADLNTDGEINYPEEATFLPCKTLEDIEALWRKYTGGRCGWQGAINKDLLPNCHELRGKSLTLLIFPRPNNLVQDRIDTCKELKDHKDEK